MASHLSLKRWFNYYNRRYFNSDLPADTKLIWSPLTDAHGQMQAGEIHMDPALQLYPKFMRIILLHELIHLRYPRLTHGKKFQAELNRLTVMGAYKGLL